MKNLIFVSTLTLLTACAGRTVGDELSAYLSLIISKLNLNERDPKERFGA